MAATKTPSRQVERGYSTWDLQNLFSTKNDGKGQIIPLHKCTIERWRRQKLIPFTRVNSRIYRYPRDVIDAMVAGKSITPTE